jgi:aspartate/methionine/tyrosine aminotransferase
VYQALEGKCAGAIRASISNVSMPAQSMLLAAWKNPAYAAEKQQAFELLQSRYWEIKRILTAHPEYQTAFEPLPFNSGYFMSFRLEKGNAEDLRKALLMEEGVGTIAIDPKCLRVAYSSIDLDKVEELYSVIYRTAERVCR